MPFFYFWLSSQSAIDVGISGNVNPPFVIILCFLRAILVSLSWLFYRSRTGDGRNMDTILKRLIRGAIQTGFFASVFAMGDLIVLREWLPMYSQSAIFLIACHSGRPPLKTLWNVCNPYW
jgi:phosphatidylglycerophosphate synthase